MKRTLLVFLAFSVLSLISVKAEHRIHVDKAKLELSVINGTDTVFTAPVCLGVNYGQKTKEGDCKTPEGNFTIWMIQNSETWTHDFNDGFGKRKGAYGPWFFRLRTPMSTHIAIHGTCFPESIGKRESEGCIRMTNEDLLKLKPYVFQGMKVHITAD